MKKALKQKIDLIPGDDGWDKRDTGDTFKRAADEMLSHGIPEDDVIDILESLHGAVANEYGD